MKEHDPKFRRGKLFYMVLSLLTLFIILPLVMALVISSRSLSTSSRQSEACLQAALKMQMLYIQEIRPARLHSEQAVSLNEGGLLETLGDQDEFADCSERDTMEQRLQALYAELSDDECDIFLYFARSGYLMSPEIFGNDALSEASSFLTEALDLIDATDANYSVTRFGTDNNGENYSLHIERAAPSVFYIYIQHGSPTNNLTDVLNENLAGVEIFFYDAHGTVHAATQDQTLIDLYNYDTLGNKDSESFSFSYEGKSYQCFYQSYSDMHTKQAVFFVDEIAQSKHTVSFLLWISAIALIVVFLSAAVFFTQKMYRPLDELIARLPSGKTRGIRDDCRILSEAITSMDSRLSEMDILVERSYLLRLLHGFDVTMYEDFLAKDDISELQGECIVAAAHADVVEDGPPPDNATFEKELCEWFQNACFRLSAVKDGEFHVLVFSLSPQQSLSDLIREFQKMQEDKTNYSLSVYLSGAHGSLRELHTAYEEAIQTAEYCMLLEKFGTILCYDSVRNVLQKKNAASPDFAQLRLLSEDISALSVTEALNQYDAILTRLTISTDRPVSNEDMAFSVLANIIAMAFFDIAGYDVEEKEVRKCAEAVRRAQDSLQLRAILEESMESFCRQNDTRSLDRERFEQVKAYVCESFRDPNLSLNLVSDRFGTCPSNITRMFKKYNQSGFLEYVRRLRVEQAIKLLRESDLAISEIASLVGYSNTVTMNHAFKNYVHSTPSLVRKKSRQKPKQ